MLDIKFKERDNYHQTVIVNNIIDEHSFSRDRKAHFYAENVLRILCSYSVDEIGEHFDSISVDVAVDWWDEMLDFDINIYPDKIVKVGLKVETDYWAAGYSLVEFCEELKLVIDSSQDDALLHFQEDEDFVSNGFGIEIKFRDTSVNFEALIDWASAIAEEVVRKAEQQLKLKTDVGSIVSIFDFPESIKTPCQQYLMYFAQFLKDLGIEAGSEIKEENSSTIFKVTPSNKNEALDKIKEALNAYINAPGLDDLYYQNINNDNIASIQFQANVMHLKSQLMFAKSALQMKDAAIEALQLSNYQLKNILAVNESKLDVVKEEADIIPGIVTVTKYEGNGFSVNLPEIFKKLKRIIK
jgi:hypothetical protein